MTGKFLADQSEFPVWKTDARSDDWHTRFVGSDIRQLIAEVERLTALVRSSAKNSLAAMAPDPKLAALRPDLPTSLAQGAWMPISVLPETDPKFLGKGIRVLLFSPNFGIRTGEAFNAHGRKWANVGSLHGNAIDDWGATHWMHLPPEPSLLPSTEHSPGCQSGDFGPCDCNLSKSKKDTCYLERSKIREILIGQTDENLHITEQILLEVDALPIVVVDDILAEHELMRRTLETIAGNSADQLQATQARGALANIGPAVSSTHEGGGK